MKDAIKRLGLKAVESSPHNLRAFNNAKAEYDEEVTNRLPPFSKNIKYTRALMSSRV